MLYKRIKILVIEDDVETARFISELLHAVNYKVICFGNANDSLEWVKTNLPDLIILDIALPGLSGIQFCKLIKENPNTSSLPVIMLTAAGDEQHKVEALKTGADDYVVKPFLIKEFLARIEAVLRRCRHQGKTDKRITFKKIEIDLDRSDVIIDGKKICLLPKEYSLLIMFLKKPEHVFAYSFIAGEVWGMDTMATRDTIKATMYRLKQKLDKYADYIQPVLGQGYKWCDKTDYKPQKDEDI